MQLLKNNLSAKIIYIILVFTLLQLFFLHFQLSPSNNKGSSNERGSVTINFADNISPGQKKIIEKFNELYKGKIKVELLNIPLQKFSSNERKQLFIKYLRSESDRIDVFAIDQVWIPRFAKWCEPLNAYFQESEMNSILDITREICTYNNSLVVIPEFIDIGVMYYRKDILKKYPEYEALKEKLEKSISWEDFIKLGHRIQKPIGPFYTFAADNYEGLICSFTELYSADSLLKNGRFNFHIGELNRTVGFISDLVNKYRISPFDVTQLQESGQTSYFLKNNGLFLRGWPNSFSYYFPNSNERVKISQLVMVPLPHFKNKKKSFVLGGWNLMLSKYSRHKNEAALFMKYWLKEATQAEMYKTNGFLPSIKIFYERMDLVKTYPELQFFKNLLPFATIRPKSEYYTNYSSVLSYYIKAVIQNNLSLKDAISKAENEINTFRNQGVK